MTDQEDRSGVTPDDPSAVPADVLASEDDHPIIPATTPGTDPAPSDGLSGYLNLWVEKLKSGELGALPIGRAGGQRSSTRPAKLFENCLTPFDGSRLLAPSGYDGCLQQ